MDGAAHGCPSGERIQSLAYGKASLLLHERAVRQGLIVSLTRAPLSLKIVLHDPMRSDDVAPEALANAGCAVIEILPGGQKSWAEEIL